VGLEVADADPALEVDPLRPEGLASGLASGNLGGFGKGQQIPRADPALSCHDFKYAESARIDKVPAGKYIIFYKYDFRRIKV
jgi:hypothetical protein